MRYVIDFKRIVTYYIFSYVSKLFILFHKIMPKYFEIELVSTHGIEAPIKLEHLKEKIIGRGANISKSVSRLQTSVTADLLKGTILVENLGKNPIIVNKTPLRFKEYTVTDSDDNIEFPDRKIYKIKRTAPTSTGDKRYKSMIEKFCGDNFFLKDEGVWKEVDGKLLIYSIHGFGNVTDKVAAFDLDGTLIKTKSGRVFPVDEEDWMLLPTVAQKLRDLEAQSFTIVIFSNQGGISIGSTHKDRFKKKINRIVSSLKINAQVFIAADYSFFRKPCPGMWYAFCLLNNATIDYNKSVFVGDAAGRPKGWKTGMKKDFSIADRLFARNIKLPFHTPEEFFHGERTSPFDEPKFDSKLIPVNTLPDLMVPSPRQEVVLMVGSPASGKSQFVRHHLVPRGYNSLSRDKLGSWQNCVKVMRRDLLLGKSVVVDNTNPSEEARRKFLDVAREHGVPARCFVMDVHVEWCKHNNKFRQLTDKDHIVVTDVIINDFWKNYKTPTITEGFTQVMQVPFIQTFKDSDEEELYKMYLT